MRNRTSPAVVLSFAALLISLTACGSAGTSPATPSQEDPVTTTPAEEGQVSGVSLEVDLGLGPWHDPDPVPDTQGLAAEYTITNAGDQAIIVATEIPADTPANGRAPDGAEGAWVYTTGSDLRLSKEIFPLAEDASQAEGPRFLVRGTRLEPGESLQGRLFAELPVREVGPNPAIFANPDAHPWRTDVTTWRACIQVRLASAQDSRSDIDSGDQAVLLCSESSDLPAGWHQ